MRKKSRILLALLCSFLVAVNVWADEGTGQDPDYLTDYYMIVESPDGGIDIHSEADPQSNKLNDDLIVNGTAVHIQGEKTGTDEKEWGYTQYHGMNGYVEMDDLKPASRSEAIASEYETFGGTDVDLEVKVVSEDGGVAVYRGPGEKFGQASNAAGIADGINVHISQHVQSEDGRNWGKICTDAVEGWIDLDKDTDYQGSAATTPTQTVSVTPAPSVTPTPQATPTETPTPTPQATPTEEITPTPEATPTEEITPTPEATPTEEATPTPEATLAEEGEETSGANIKTAKTSSSVIGVSVAGILLIIAVLVYFLRKKK